MKNKQVKRKPFWYILIQFVLIATAAILAFYIADDFGRHYQYVEVFREVRGEMVSSVEQVLTPFWQYYAFSALGIAIVLVGGFFTVVHDTLGWNLDEKKKRAAE